MASRGFKTVCDVLVSEITDLMLQFLAPTFSGLVGVEEFSPN